MTTATTTSKSTPTLTAATTAAIPAPRPATLTGAAASALTATSTRRGPTAEQDCSMCSGVGGKFVTTDGQTPRKALGDWVPCTGCNGTGKVGEK